MDVHRAIGLKLSRAMATVSTLCRGRVRRWLAVHSDHLRTTFFVDQAVYPWHSFLREMGSLQCVYSGSFGRKTLSMEEKRCRNIWESSLGTPWMTEIELLR